MSLQNIGSIKDNLESLSIKSIKNQENKENTISFTNVLSDTLNKVNDKHIESDKMITDFISGESNISIHEVMLAQQEAGLSMQLLIEVRNKVTDMYNELKNVQM